MIELADKDEGAASGKENEMAVCVCVWCALCVLCYVCRRDRMARTWKSARRSLPLMTGKCVCVEEEEEEEWSGMWMWMEMKEADEDGKELEMKETIVSNEVVFFHSFP